VNILTTPLPLIQPGQNLTEQTKQVDQQQGTGFGEFLSKAIDEVNNLQQQSAEMKTKLVTGEIEDIHQVMIAAEKANLAFQLTVQIRNKVVEAYQEIMRMQI